VIGSIDLYRLVGIALAVVVWQLASLAIGGEVLPDPVTVLSYIAENLLASEYLLVHRLPGGDGGWLPQIAYSVRNVFLGVTIGTAIGVSLGLLSVRLPVIAEVAAPVTGTFGAAPIVISIPFFMIWFGIVPTAQVIILAFYTTILLFIYSRRAAQNVRADYVEYAATLGSDSWMTFRRLLLPASVPEVLAGLRIALAGSWGLEAIAELLGAQGGAGFLMKFYAGAFILEGMLGITLILGIIAVVCDFIVVRAAGYLTRWSESGHQLQL
jgi:ABC-type nitrate/sulfonate/bicarbonate transport system permease component